MCSSNVHPVDLDETGWAMFSPELPAESLSRLRETIFAAGSAGTRCLLDDAGVAAVAREICAQLVRADVLAEHSVAIQAIAFDKTPAANWKVTWHQDVMFPFAQAVRAPGYDLATVKDAVDYARPPRPVLEQMLAVRLHLDPCDENNGPLRVSPGTHRAGVLRSTEIAGQVASHGEKMCLAQAGEALLMRPLLLHASSPAKLPAHRRVLHLVYHSGERLEECWHRAMGA